MSINAYLEPPSLQSVHSLPQGTKQKVTSDGATRKLRIRKLQLGEQTPYHEHHMVLAKG